MWIKLWSVGRTPVRKGNWWRRYCCHNGRIYTQMRRWCVKSLRRTRGSDGKVHIKGVGWISGIMDEPLHNKLLEVESQTVRPRGRINRWGRRRWGKKGV